MPSFGSKVQLSSTAQDSNIVLADIDRIKGAFKVYTSTELNSTNVNYFSDGQIVYVSDSASLYRANVSLANPPITFSDTVSFSQFSFDSGSFVSASFDGVHTLTLFGQDIDGSTRVSSSVDLSALTGSGGGGGGGGGDITAVFTSDQGITGGASSGNVVLELDAGSGILLNTSGINVDTGSAHFTGGVQKVTIDGGNI
jgi:hypothetical protein|tara:strand:- start:119 stop:712 length:594 start_codon:yes stop_codon:yes gene_type:complete